MSLSTVKVSAVLLAGGQGLRFGVSTPKQYIPLAGKPLALYSLEQLLHCPSIFEIIVVCSPSYENVFSKMCNTLKFALPGKRRQDSVLSGFNAASKEAELILIHDAARPAISQEDISKVIHAGERYGAACLASPVKMTIKQGDNQGMVVQTLDRSTLYEVQTPQVLTPDVLSRGFKKARARSLSVTDDVSLAELIDHPVKLVMGSHYNLKVTSPEDLDIATTYLTRIREENHFAQV